MCVDMGQTSLYLYACLSQIFNPMDNKTIRETQSLRKSINRIRDRSTSFVREMFFEKLSEKGSINIAELARGTNSPKRNSDPPVAERGLSQNFKAVFPQ